MLEIIMKAIDFSALAYEHPADIENEIKDQADGFRWIEDKETDTQAFICEDEDNVWVTVRGTEFDNISDWITNLKCGFVDGPWGPVHEGFWTDVTAIRSDVYINLVKYIVSKKEIIFTGHSQGAAEAELIFADRQQRSSHADQICIPIEPPRSMGRSAAVKFGRVYGQSIYHVINNNDIVCRVPTRLMGYAHVDNINLNYLDEDGNLHHDISWWERFKDRIKGRIYDFGELGTDGIKDHSITEVQRIWKNLC